MLFLMVQLSDHRCQRLPALNGQIVASTKTGLANAEGPFACNTGGVQLALFVEDGAEIGQGDRGIGMVRADAGLINGQSLFLQCLSAIEVTTRSVEETLQLLRRSHPAIVDAALELYSLERLT
jgi:hypothetical protein